MANKDGGTSKLTDKMGGGMARPGGSRDDIEKITIAEALAWGIPIAFVEFFCAILDVFTAGIFMVVSTILKAFGKIWFDWFLQSKNGNKSRTLDTQLGKWGYNSLPGGTFLMFIVSVFNHNHPKLTGFIYKKAGIKFTGMMNKALWTE